MEKSVFLLGLSWMVMGIVSVGNNAVPIFINATINDYNETVVDDPRFSHGVLAHGLPAHVLANLPMANLSLFGNEKPDYLGLNESGIKEFVDLLNSPHYDEKKIVKKDLSSNNMYTYESVSASF